MNSRDERASALGYMAMPAGFPYRSVFLHGRPHHEKYDEFWLRHPPMDAAHRAKIFAPFDALAGFSSCIAGKEVEYRERRILSQGEREELDRKISLLRRLTRSGKAARANRPEITVRYFSPCTDPESSAFGSGGIYETLHGICRKVDDLTRTILIDETVLSIEDITAITGALFDHTSIH